MDEIEHKLIGYKLIGIVNKITAKGCYCALGVGYGYMPKALMDGLVDDDGNYLISIGDRIETYVHDIKRGIILLESVKNYEVAQEKKSRAKQFAEHHKSGYVSEAEVVKIKKDEVIIRLGDYEGVISKEEIDWNKINRLENLLYEGEKVNVFYVKYDPEQGHLLFSLKYFKEKPYEESYYDMDTWQLLSFVGHSSNSFIGVAKSYGSFVFIENLYSVDDKTRGKLLVDPIYGYNLRALVLNKNLEVEDGKYYKVNIKLNPKDKRQERNQLFQFFCTSIEEAENPYKSDVSLAFKKRTTDPSANQTIAGLLKTVSKDMYSSKDRMFFELVQNADDASAEKGVFIDVVTIGDYLVVCHNGFSFNKDDFEAITTAANGTKKANENKTGYKGIGFKSVFTDSEKVFISTGGYKFMFDRDEEIFKDFDKFYLDNNPMIISTESRQKFLALYDSERRKFDKTNSIPWQLEPIWVNDFPSELGSDFLRSNVSIALKIGEHKLSGENGYISAIDEIICNPIFMLFLRNTNRIDFNGRSISKSLKNNVITLKNSFNDRRVEQFERVDFVTPVTNESFENSSVDIRIVVEEEDEGRITEAKFVDLKNQVFENIPKKIAITNATTISFAVPINEDGTLNPICKRTEISMFAFLPTLVKDFRFPFYVNANFILDPPRQRILGDNPWNFYLMQEIAQNLVKWCATLSQRGDKNALNILLPEYFEENTPDTRQLSEHFNVSYKKSLETESFILNHTGGLSKQNEIIIDKTGLSIIVGARLFCDVIGTSKYLPFPGVDSTILNNRSTFEQIEIVDLSKISSKLSNSELFRDWLTNASPEQLSQFFDWLKKNQKGCVEVIKSLPLFQFEDGFKSRTEIQNDTTRIITTKKNLPIRDVLGKLGFKCSIGVFDNHPISELINGQNEKDIFGSISKKLPSDSLSTQDKLSLIRTLVDFSGVGETMISQLALFHNEDGKAKPLGEMTRYKESYSTWLNPFMLKQDEFNEELSKYLIDESSVFEKIVSRNYCNIRVSLYEMYQHFSGSWTGQFTRKVIDFYGPNESVLPIVEVSDLQTQQYFLSKIPRIDLKDGDNYNKESFIHRVLMIALSILDDPSSFSQKIFYNGFCIKDFSIKDSVNCEYTSNGVNKKVTFSLSRLLPNYQNKSGLIEKVLSLFEPKQGLEKFFDAKSKPNDELYSELNTQLGIPHPMYGPWQPGLGNAQQYLYSVFRRKQVWSVLKGMQIQLEKESNDFIVELLDILFHNNIDIATSPFTYHLKGYFIGKFFDCDYVFVPECILGIVEKWADDPKKKDYLVRNGVRDVSCDAIRFRQLFLENKSTGELGTLLDKDLQSAIEFFAGASSCQRPFTGNYQKELLLKLRVNRQYNLVSQCNLKELASISQEWDGKEYKEWVISRYPKIFFFDGELPMGLFYKDSALIHFREGHHFYDTSNRILYISRDVELEDTLFAIAREGKSGLNLDDYRTLCMSGKVSVSKDEIETKDKQISSLMKDNQEKDELLQRYRAKYGSLDDEVEEEANDSDPNMVTVKKGENEPMSKDKQIDAQIEAQKFLMQVMKSWSFPEGYGETDELGKPCHFSTVVVQDESGASIPIVLKSYKKTSEPFKINTEEWDWIIQDGADLLIYDGSDIKRHDINDLVRNQSNVSITFSTENLDIEERISSFSDSLHYFKELHFDFDSFNISKKAKSVKDIYNTNVGSQNNFSDEEAL